MNHQPTVLLVEDNHTDALLFCIAVKRSSLRVRTQVLNDGHDAIRYLRGEGVFGDRKVYPLPGLVVLDLHMPGVGGLAVLRWIRKQRWLVGLPVVVFTGTDYERSLGEAMESGADTYLLKGHDTEGLLTLLQNADLNWNDSQAGIEDILVKRSA